MNNLPDQEGNLPSENVSNSTRRPVTDPLSPLPLTRIIILTLISKYPGITGYELMQLVPQKLHPSITLNTGTVYSELRRLDPTNEDKTKPKPILLTSEQSKTGRKHRRYTITKLGKGELKLLAQQIQNRRNFVIGPLLKLIDKK